MIVLHGLLTGAGIFIAASIQNPATIISAALSRYCRGGEFGEAWRTEPNVGRVAYGVPAGMERLRELGNAVIPQIPQIIGEAIMAHHNLQQ